MFCANLCDAKIGKHFFGRFSAPFASLTITMTNEPVDFDSYLENVLETYKQEAANDVENVLKAEMQVEKAEEELAIAKETLQSAEAVLSRTKQRVASLSNQQWQADTNHVLTIGPATTFMIFKVDGNEPAKLEFVAASFVDGHRHFTDIIDSHSTITFPFCEFESVTSSKMVSTVIVKASYNPEPANGEEPVPPRVFLLVSASHSAK
jgi:hypothetical protein